MFITQNRVLWWDEGSLSNASLNRKLWITLTFHYFCLIHVPQPGNMIRGGWNDDFQACDWSDETFPSLLLVDTVNDLDPYDMNISMFVQRIKSKIGNWNYWDKANRFLFISFIFMRKYLDGAHSCVSISNGMRHSNDYGDMELWLDVWTREADSINFNQTSNCFTRRVALDIKWRL